LIPATKPLILVTNDDGIDSKGIRVLIDIATDFGDVHVIAPDTCRSATSHSVSVNTPLFLNKLEYRNGLIKYSCSGTAVDCVKFALNEISDRKPDFILAGINHGTNSAISIVYSGTMGAAMEGCIHGIPSAGFSLFDKYADADFTMAEFFTRKIVEQMIKSGLPDSTCLNVNFPDLPVEKIKGVKICRQAKSKWAEKFEKKTDNKNGSHYLLSGDFYNYEPDAADTDIWALHNGYISIVPVGVDYTAHQSIGILKVFENEIKI
jgi:5'-nucleotidase